MPVSALPSRVGAGELGEEAETDGAGDVLFWNHLYVCTGSRYRWKSLYPFRNKNDLGILCVPYDKFSLNVR